jgi:hypothetical protein
MMYCSGHYIISRMHVHAIWLDSYNGVVANRASLVLEAWRRQVLGWK